MKVMLVCLIIATALICVAEIVKNGRPSGCAGLFLPLAAVAGYRRQDVRYS